MVYYNSGFTIFRVLFQFKDVNEKITHSNRLNLFSVFVMGKVEKDDLHIRGVTGVSFYYQIFDQYRLYNCQFNVVSEYK